MTENMRRKIRNTGTLLHVGDHSLHGALAERFVGVLFSSEIFLHPGQICQADRPGASVDADGRADTGEEGLDRVEFRCDGFQQRTGFDLGVGVERGQPERSPPFNLVADEHDQAVHGFTLGACFFDRFDPAVPEFQHRFNVQDGAHQSLCAANAPTTVQEFQGFYDEKDAGVLPAFFGTKTSPPFTVRTMGGPA